MREKAEQGTWPSSAPIGYMNIVRDTKRLLAADPEKAGIIVRIALLTASWPLPTLLGDFEPAG